MTTIETGSILTIGSDCWLTGKIEIFAKVHQAGAETHAAELVDFRELSCTNIFNCTTTDRGKMLFIFGRPLRSGYEPGAGQPPL
jgi:hypothetical protein